MKKKKKEALKEKLIDYSDAINRSEESFKCGLELIDKYLERYSELESNNELFTKLHNKLEMELTLKFVFK